MNDRPIIEGAKGGGSGSSGNVEASNTLRSVAKAKLIDLLCEGPILGLVEEIDNANGKRSIIVNDVPIANPDNSLNYEGFAYQIRLGTSDQDYIEGFENIASEFSVNRRVKNSSPVVYATQGAELTSIVVTLLLPSLAIQDDKTGNLNGYNTAIAIDIKDNSNPLNAWVAVVSSDYISGKTTSNYERSYRVQLPVAGSPYLVRMRRLSPDNDANVKIQDKTYFSRITEIIDHKITYADSAIIATDIDAEQFGGNVASRKYDIYAQLMEYPSNYDPVARTYTGFWDGTYSYGYTNNPAWFFRLVATNNRFGAGIYNEAIDKWGLYQISKFCDELVPDGRGGFEPRFTFNGIITKEQEAYKLLQLISSIMRGIIFYGAGVVIVRIDQPMEVEHKLFTLSNIIGEFAYTSSAKNVRHTACVVKFTNPEIDYDDDFEIYENRKGILRYGYNLLSLESIGTTSRGQAYRLGKWAVLTALLQTDAVSFDTGFEGSMVLPGDIIEIADPAQALADFGGRLLPNVGCGPNQVILDREIGYAIATAPELHIALLDGSYDDVTGLDNTDRPLKRKITYFSSAVTAYDNVTNKVTLLDNLPAGAYSGTHPLVWIFSSDAIPPIKYKVIGVKENKDDDKLTYSIDAIAYSPEKFTQLDEQYDLDVDGFPNQSATSCVPPTNLVVLATTKLTSSILTNTLTASWTASIDPQLAGYSYSYKKDDENWSAIQTTTSTGVEIVGLPPGNYSFRLYASNNYGAKSVVLVGTPSNPNNKYCCRDVITTLTTDRGDATFKDRDINIKWTSNAPSAALNYSQTTATWQRPDVGEITGQAVVASPQDFTLTITLSGTVVIDDEITVNVGNAKIFTYVALSTSLTAFAEGIKAAIDADANLVAVRSGSVVTVTIDSLSSLASNIGAEQDTYFGNFRVVVKGPIIADYAQLNPTDKDAAITLSNSNRTATKTGATAWASVRSLNKQVSGRYYLECRFTTFSANEVAAGFANATEPLSSYLGNSTDGISVRSDGRLYTNNTLVASVPTLGAFAAGDRVCLAIDLDAKLMWARKNGGNWNGSATASPCCGIEGLALPASLLSGDIFAGLSLQQSGNVSTVNYGDSAFTYTMPDGYNAWNDGPTLRTEYTKTPSYTYTYALNLVDAGGSVASRSVTFQVAAIDTDNNVSKIKTLTATNAIPVLGGTPVASGVLQGIQVTGLTAPTDPDFVGIKVYMNLTTGFTPGSGNLVYKGPILTPTMTRLGTAAHYLRVQPYDAFSEDDGALSAEFSATPTDVDPFTMSSTGDQFTYSNPTTLSPGSQTITFTVAGSPGASLSTTTWSVVGDVTTITPAAGSTYALTGIAFGTNTRMVVTATCNGRSVSAIVNKALNAALTVPFGFAVSKTIASIVTNDDVAGFDTPIAWNLRTGLTNSQGTIAGNGATAPGAQTDFDIRYSGASIGTMRFASGSLTATFIKASDSAIPLGGIVTVKAPSNLNGMAGILYFTILGDR